MAVRDYYYRMLNRQEQQFYHALKEGISSQAASIPIPLLQPQQMTDIFFLMRLDHPEIFWVESFRYRYMNGAENGELIPDYVFQKNKIRDQQTAMQSRVKKLAAQWKGLKEEEQLQRIHDLICTGVKYDKLKKSYSHEIIGPLGQGVGVCEGIAKSVKILCDELGIWCIIAVSEANPEKKIKYRHAWNVVKIGGKTYHLDATFDNSLYPSGEPRYDYYMLSDEQIFRDHEPLIRPIPPCTDGKRFFYREKKLSFTTVEEVGKRAAQAVKKKRPLVFHWRGGYLTRTVLEDLLAVIHEAAAAKQCFARVSLNWPQAVLYVSFHEQEPEEEMIWEEANEAERDELGDESGQIDISQRQQDVL